MFMVLCPSKREQHIRLKGEKCFSISHLHQSWCMKTLFTEGGKSKHYSSLKIKGLTLSSRMDEMLRNRIAFP